MNSTSVSGDKRFGAVNYTPATQVQVPAQFLRTTASNSSSVQNLSSTSAAGFSQELSSTIARLKQALQALNVVTNPQASDEKKILAVAQLAVDATTTPFTGSLDIPESIGGVPVVGSAVTDDGSQGFLLADGEVVPRDTLVNRSNALAALQAVAIVGSDASDTDKALALGSLGVRVGAINEILSEVRAGQVGAIINLVQSARNFEDMSAIEQITTVTQTADLAFSAFGGASAGSTTGAVLSGVAGVGGIVMGIDQAADVFDALDDMNKSQGVGAGAVGLGAAGASIGAGIAGVSAAITAATATGASAGSVVPVVGTAIGAAVGLVVGAAIGAVAGLAGSGKSSAQKIRDNWRDGLEEAGFAVVLEGSHNVQLADGSLYDIGRDGGHQLVNADGTTTRHTFDVDWSSKLAVESVADAHLFAIATGVDPSVRDHGAFPGVVAQSLNAATSNASTQEEVRANFRHMLEAGGISPQQLGLQVEVLRHSEKISEGEYKVYIAHINQMFGSQITTIEKAQGQAKLVQLLSAKGENMSEGEQRLLADLTDPNKLAENASERADRLQEHEQNQAGFGTEATLP